MQKVYRHSDEGGQSQSPVATKVSVVDLTKVSVRCGAGFSGDEECVSQVNPVAQPSLPSRQQLCGGLCGEIWKTVSQHVRVRFFRGKTLAPKC